MQVLDFPKSDIVALPPEGDEGMAAGTTNKERLDDHESRIEQVEAALGLIPPKPKTPFQTFRDHVAQQIHAHWKTVLPVVAVCLTIFGWFVVPLIKQYMDHKYDFINTMIADNLTAKGGINEKLGQIQQTVTSTKATLDTLQPFIHDVIQHQFESTSKLPVSTLQERLPAVKHLVEAAQDQQVKIDPTLVTSISKHFLQIPKRESDYWQAAGSLISYNSFNSNSWALPASLPDCMDSEPRSMATFTVKSSAGNLPLDLGAYENCRLTLDSNRDGERLEQLLHKFATLWFSQCEIIYRGGTLISVLAWSGQFRTVASVASKEGGTFWCVRFVEVHGVSV